MTSRVSRNNSSQSHRVIQNNESSLLRNGEFEKNYESINKKPLRYPTPSILRESKFLNKSREGISMTNLVPNAFKLIEEQYYL